MDRGYEMKWEKFTGTARGRHGKASMEMMDLHEPHWFCRFESYGSEQILVETKGFKVGELEQAHEWCIAQVKENDDRKR